MKQDYIHLQVYFNTAWHVFRKMQTVKKLTNEKNVYFIGIGRPAFVYGSCRY